jgi:hypothetical protein
MILALPANVVIEVDGGAPTRRGFGTALMTPAPKQASRRVTLVPDEAKRSASARPYSLTLMR